ESKQSPESEKPAEGEQTKELKIQANEGWNRFVWDMRYPNVVKLEGNDPPAEANIAGPMVVPGSYQVTLKIGEQSFSQPFEILPDPSGTATAADLQAQFDLLMQIYGKSGEMIVALNRMRDLRQQLGDWSKRAEGLANGKEIAQAAKALQQKVLEIEKVIQ